MTTCFWLQLWRCERQLRLGIIKSLNRPLSHHCLVVWYQSQSKRRVRYSVWFRPDWTNRCNSLLTFMTWWRMSCDHMTPLHILPLLVWTFFCKFTFRKCMFPFWGAMQTGEKVAVQKKSPLSWEAVMNPPCTGRRPRRTCPRPPREKQKMFKGFKCRLRLTGRRQQPYLRSAYGETTYIQGQLQRERASFLAWWKKTRWRWKGLQSSYQHNHSSAAPVSSFWRHGEPEGVQPLRGSVASSQSFSVCGAAGSYPHLLSPLPLCLFFHAVSSFLSLTCPQFCPAPTMVISRGLQAQCRLSVLLTEESLLI